MDPSVRIDRADIESAKPYQLNELLALAGMEVADEPGGRPRRLVGSQPPSLSHDLTRRDNAGAASSKVQQLYLVENVSTSKYNRVDTANDALSQPQARRSHRQSVSAQRPHFQLNAADSILSGAEMLFRGAQVMEARAIGRWTKLFSLFLSISLLFCRACSLVQPCLPSFLFIIMKQTPH
jgi:hypothetical protein